MDLKVVAVPAAAAGGAVGFSVKKMAIRNICGYDEFLLKIEEGITVIRGYGKTSLIKAFIFGLYGAGYYKPNVILKLGQPGGEIVLDELKRELKVSPDDAVVTESCVGPKSGYLDDGTFVELHTMMPAFFPGEKYLAILTLNPVHRMKFVKELAVKLKIDAGVLIEVISASVSEAVKVLYENSRCDFEVKESSYEIYVTEDTKLAPHKTLPGCSAYGHHVNIMVNILIKSILNKKLKLMNFLFVELLDKQACDVWFFNRMIAYLKLHKFCVMITTWDEKMDRIGDRTIKLESIEMPWKGRLTEWEDT
ncbi:MAG: hypothetical protein Hyperionvirus1_190 [Hyperionvirus sp.]|uniref:Uncharacterized protein n=1 Tax=Hyperionvirus sp. TaxID=2487770 RepID=A0A3G5A8V4_9VIRU|nr:MAG: hypothetical protein Hyperionvirus1_190 [Hyperionvirus sp.]